ncbi:MAG: hypothetical protein ACRDPO_20585 [Streptosporangiaceae bacterium]
MAIVTAPRPRIWPFFAWAAVGAGWCVALLGVLSIGLFVLPLVIGALIVLLVWPGGRTIAALGAVSGLGLVPLVVAYLNRGGPGDVCTTSASGGQSCTTEWSPWPWLGAGLALVALGAVAFGLLRARLSQVPSAPPPPRPGPG